MIVGMLKHLFSSVMLGFLFSISAQAEESIKADHLKIFWIAPAQFSPSTEKIGIHFEIDPHWHVYWKNPGDSGTSPKFKISSENKTKWGEIEWPFPQRLPFAHLTNLGYEKNVVYLFDVTPDKAGVQLEVNLEWLVCQEECIPGFGKLTLNRPTGSLQWSPAILAIRDEFKLQTPQEKALSPWQFEQPEVAVKDGKTFLKIQVKPKGDWNQNAEAPEVFPVDGNLLSPASPEVKRVENFYEFTFLAAESMHQASQTDFVIGNKKASWEIKNVPLRAKANSESKGISLEILILLASAFVGGIILNLMPCVLPVLSIKFFSLAKTPREERMKEAFAYTAGVLVTFLVLGVVFLGLRAAGSAIGWGFQLQSPAIVFGLIILFVLMAFNFFGFFEWGTEIMNWAGRSKSSSSFSTGILSVFVAAPCTGPFMGSALGAAATLPSIWAVLIFVSLGLGLAFPFIILAMSPGLMSKIPKPGPWMESLKQFFAFPLFATAIWLSWVLSLQAGPEVWPILLSLTLALAFAIWLGKSQKYIFLVIAWAIAVWAIGISYYQIKQASNQAVVMVDQRWNAFEPVKIAEAQSRGQAVFIDFTAAWCITCQVNKKAVLETEAAQDIFRKNNVYLVRADWTKQDPIITQALAQLGRNSVPVYAFYASGSKEAQLLPQILSLSNIENLFQQGEVK